MKIGGIVAEFNPFHNGHAALVNAAKAAGAEYIVAVMSGNFAQRGEAAIADKHLRTRLALAGGVDLVLELPLAYSVATAERFALGAVSLMSACGAVDTLVFGSECGRHTDLQRLADTVDCPAVRMEIGSFLSRGMTFAKARQLAVEKVAGKELSELLATPNNALAVEYLRAAKKFDWNDACSVPGHKCADAAEPKGLDTGGSTAIPGVFTVPRLMVSHDAKEPVGNAASASYLRRHAGNIQTLVRYMPPAVLEEFSQAIAAGDCPVDKAKLETAMLSHLRRLDIQQLRDLPDLSEGLENRLYGAVRSATSIEELYALIKTKRYTLARVRRLVLAAFLGLTKRHQDTPPAYIRVLGYRKSAKPLMSLIGQSAILPVGTSLTRLARSSPAAARQAALEASAGDQYSLCLPNPRPCGHEFRAKVEVV